MIKEWIVTFSGTNIAGAVVQRVLGTDEQIQEYLIQMIKEDIEIDKENFNCGTTEIKDLIINVGDIYGYTMFSDHRIHYQAVLLDKVERKVLAHEMEV